MFDPYARDAPSVGEPANDLFAITPSDTENIQRGVKAFRVFNPNNEAASLTVETVSGSTVTIWVPANSLWVEPLRVRAVLQTGTTEGLSIHGYTD